MDARPARRATILFGCVLAMVGAVVGWWWVLNLKTAATERAQKTEWMGAEAALAQRLLAQSADPQADEYWLRHHYPHLSVSCAATSPPVRGCAVEVAPEQIEALSGRFAARVRMFVGEGATLVVLLALGATLVLRAMIREVQMLRQQGNFLAAVTHELKSPLATIRLYVETLRRRKLTAEREAEYLGTLDEETRRLESLVNHVLLASRLSLGPGRRRSPKSPTIDLVATTEKALAATRPEQALAWTPPPAPIWAAIEPNDWLTICRNLFDNARKYGQGPMPAKVMLLGTARGLAMLSVADSGMGLSKANLKRVFDRFYRVGDELVRGHEGSGLGLYLVSALAQAAGGKVWVESLGLKRGATFFVVVPMVPASATKAATATQAAWEQAESIGS